MCVNYFDYKLGDNAFSLKSAQAICSQIYGIPSVEYYKIGQQCNL